jgi:hypothetical protein
MIIDITLDNKQRLLLTAVWLRLHPTGEVLDYFFGVVGPPTPPMVRQMRLPLEPEPVGHSDRLPRGGGGDREFGEVHVASNRPGPAILLWQEDADHTQGSGKCGLGGSRLSHLERCTGSHCGHPLWKASRALRVSPEGIEV